MAVTALKLPTLPADLKWSVDRHTNAFIGPVCALRIIRPRQRKVFGLNIRWNESLAYAVIPNDNQWINEEAEYLIKTI
jgi:hypothetical protein